MTAALETESPDATPDWYLRAVADEPEVRQITVASARISFRVWDRAPGPTVVLVHGAAANACWWDHIAPLLASAGRVAAVDLSGHGESGHRAFYDHETWADEVLAVVTALGGPTVVVGHSLGGMVALVAAAKAAAQLAGILVVDAPIDATHVISQTAQRIQASGILDVRSSLEEQMARWRPLPDHGPLPHYLHQRLAERSVRKVDDGYTWQFDPRIFGASRLTIDEAPRLGCAVALISAELGSLRPAMSERLAARVGPQTLRLTIPGSGHHVMLDQPLALLSAIEALVGSWTQAIQPFGQIGEHT